MMTCSITTLRYSTGLLSVAPLARKQLKVALPICLPLQQYLSSAWVALSRYLVKLRLEWLACSTVPAPAVLRVGLVGCEKPWLQERISSSCLCSAALLPPSMAGSSNLMYMLVAMLCVPPRMHGDYAGGGGSSATSRIEAVSSSSWKWGRRKTTAR